MGAFGDAFAAVEDRFLAALFDAALVSDDTWNQVQRLDVAVQETGVLHRDQAESLIKWNQVARNSKIIRFGLRKQVETDVHDR